MGHPCWLLLSGCLSCVAGLLLKLVSECGGPVVGHPRWQHWHKFIDIGQPVLFAVLVFGLGV